VAEIPSAGTVRGSTVLDGIGADDPGEPAWSGIGAPAAPEALDAWTFGEAPELSVAVGTPLAMMAPAPPLDALAELVRAAGSAGSETLVETGAPPPRLAYVAGDLVVTDGRRGAGLLFVEGMLDIRGSLDFTGIVVTSGGIRVAAGANFRVDGALWLGAPVTLEVDGNASVGRNRAAAEAADALLTLPRRAVVRGLRDLG
jgi:hypothetical protein